MKRKLFAVFCLTVWVASWWVSFWLFAGLTLLGFLGGAAIAGNRLGNRLLKKTNWYKNQFVFTSFSTSYRDNLVRNYEVANVGSNPARFAFFYETVKGQNWSTGSQALDMDLEVLKYYHSYLKEGGYVLVPIVPFTSVSASLRFGNMNRAYKVKFASVLNYWQVVKLPGGLAARQWIDRPLSGNWKALRYLLKDVEKDKRLDIVEQPMESIELRRDAEGWMRLWKNEFSIKDWEAPLDARLQKDREQSVKDLQAILDFCLERNLRPVIVIPPMSAFLAAKFTKRMRETYIYSFIRQANVRKVPFLDYLDDPRFTDVGLYFNSFFLNLRGRKLFTKQVLADLGIPDGAGLPSGVRREEGRP